MPYITMKTNGEITKEKELVIKKKFGKAIELIPGKNEEWLMVSLEDRCSLYFRGEADKPIAFVEVKLLGSSTKEAYHKLTAEISAILKDELNITPNQVYVRYEETEYWGWNGGNF